MKVQITQKHINAATALIGQRPRPLPSRDCMVAQALKQEFPKERIVVAYDTAFVGAGLYRLVGANKYTRLMQEEWQTAQPGEIEAIKII
jgi:hypothetical protein